MLTTRKKALSVMQKGIVTYKLIGLGWDISDHLGDGYDLLGEKDGEIIKIELKAIDLTAIKKKVNMQRNQSRLTKLLMRLISLSQFSKR